MFKRCITLCFLLIAAQASHAQVTLDAANAPMLNQLADHPSPYLALHGQDPVAWQDWGEDVIARAKRENKLILISSGYFSCHWCHVMQRESYQNADVAKIMNASFIPVKVDRELEPALDKRLMAYAQATLKRGGWPLNVFMSPDGLPVFAVLYQPQPQFLALLNQLTGVWTQQSGRIRELALKEKVPVTFAAAKPEVDAKLASELQALTVHHIMQRADDIEGGFGQSNKFPSAPQLIFLLDSLAKKPNSDAAEFLTLTLDAMAEKGMWDHLTGGFYRYVVDPSWNIPHFEKMLYDNANLARVYLKAGAVLKEPAYTQIARETLAFMSAEMAHDNGALYAAFSAVDDNGVEGGYYLWTSEQLQNILDKDELLVFSTAWQTDRANDLEEGNHLRDHLKTLAVAEALKLNKDKVTQLLASAKDKLIKARNKRILPTDDKLLGGWNGLALSAFSLAAISLDIPEYQTQAQKIRDFIVNSLWKNQTLTRSLSKGKLIGTAAIEDYAFIAEGLFNWASLTTKTEDYQLAEDVLAQAWSRFYQNNAWSYADTSLLPPADGEEILSEDSSASPSALLLQTTIALHQAGKLRNAELYSKALSALNRGEAELRANPFWHATQIAAMVMATGDGN